MSETAGLRDDIKAARRHLQVVEGGGSKYAAKKARQRVEALEAELELLELDAAEARLYRTPDASEKAEAAARKAAELAGFATLADVRALAPGQREAARRRREAAEQRQVVEVLEQRFDGSEASARALVEAIRDLRILEQLALTAEADALADSDGDRGELL